MPTLPVYQSKQNIQPTTSAPLESPQPFLRDEAAKPFEQDQKVLGTLDQVTQKLSDANDVMQFTQAKSNAQMAIAQQEALAKADTNPNNADAHIKAIQSATSSAVDGISNQMVAQRAAQEIKADAFVSTIKINSLFKEKQMLQNDITLGNTADLAAQSKSNALTDAQGQQIEHDFLRTINENYMSGLITEGRAKGLIDDYRMGEVKNDIIKEGALQEGQSHVLSEINKGVNGRYAALSTDQRTEASRMVRLQIQQNVQIGVGQTLDNRVSTIKQIASGDLTWQNTGIINKVSMTDPKLGEAMQAVFDRNLKGKQYTPQDDKDKDFAVQVKNIFSSKTKEEVSDYLIQTLYSAANKNMSRDRMAILVNAAEQRGSTLSTMQGSSDAKESPQQQGVDNAVKHVQNFVDNNPKSEGVFASFMKNMSSGSAPAQAKDDAIKSYNLQQYPWLGNVPDKGIPGRDKITGARIRAFKDGHIEDDK